MQAANIMQAKSYQCLQQHTAVDCAGLAAALMYIPLSANIYPG